MPISTNVLQPIYNYQAIEFAEDDYVLVTDVSWTLDGSQSFSIGAWIRPLDVGENLTLVASQPEGFSLGMSEGVPFVSWAGAAWSPAEAPLILDQWQYLLVTYASTGAHSGTLSFFVDGAPCGSQAISGMATPTATTATLGGGVNAHCLCLSFWNVCLEPTSPSFQPMWQAPSPESALQWSVDFTVSPPQDVSGNNHPIAIGDTTDAIACCPSLRLGDGDYAQPSAADGVNPGNGAQPFSAAAWVCPKAPSMLDDSTTATVLANGDLMSLSAFGLFLQFDASTSTYALAAQLGGAAGAQLVSSTSFPVETWHHVAVTFDGTTLTTYLDGQSTGAMAVTSPAAIAAPNLLVGAAPDSSEPGGVSHFYAGYMQAVGVWSVALTATQVQGFMTTEPDATSGCVAYYGFNVEPDNAITGEAVALFVDAAIAEMQTTSPLQSATSGATPRAPAALRTSNRIAPPPVADPDARPKSSLLTSAQVDTLISRHEKFLGAHAPAKLRETYRTLFRRNLYAGMRGQEAAGGPSPGMITYAVVGKEIVFHHHTSNGPVECGRALTADLSPMTAWIISVVATCFSLLMSVLGVGFLAAKLVSYLTRWASGAVAANAGMQELRWILSQSIQADTPIRVIRSLYSAGVLGSAIAAGLSGVSWWSWAFTVVSVSLQIASLWLTGGLFLVYMLAQLALGIAQLVYVIGQKPSGANAVPILNGLNPGNATTGGPAFTLTVYGTRFLSGATVYWNGSARTTTYVSDTQLTAQINAADIATTGQAQVTAQNPGSDTASTALLFTVAAQATAVAA